MLINYDVEKLQNTLKHFYDITGVNLRFVTPDFTLFPTLGEHNEYCGTLKTTPEGDNYCLHSDMSLIKKSCASKKTEIHTCYAGLTDAVVPIFWKDSILGYIILGQIKTSDNFSYDKISHLGINCEKAKKLYDALPHFDFSKLDSLIEIVMIIVKNILLENILTPKLVQNIDMVTQYIDANLNTHLSIKDISKNTNLSKSTLYNEFHKHFGCTVNEYINQRRIEKSVEYLTTTDMSIDEISQKVGFSSASYYSTIFKKIKGMSPLKYKHP